MVRTPWGYASEQRSRRLRPGPGTDPVEVARNQRERLFAAMVALVAERGYEATSVEDLLKLSGVSRSTFYEHFADKQACFVATVEAIIEAAMHAIAPLYDGQGAALRALIGLIAEQPAAARVCFVEAYLGGPEAVAAVDGAVANIEALWKRGLRERTNEEVPAEITRAIVGGLRKVIHTRLYRNEEKHLPELADQLWTWAGSYRPPPQRLRARRTVPVQSQEFVGYNKMERIGYATAVVMAEKGYAATSTQEIAERASISLSTFYQHFDGKEEAVLAALELSGARMLAAIVPSVRRAPDWRHAVRVLYETMCAYIAAEPAFGQLAVVEAYAAGPRALAERDKVIDALAQMLAAAYEEVPSTPPIAAEAIGGAIYALLYDQIRSGGPQSLPQIAPLATYLTLTPFLGPYEAAVIANDNGSRGRRRG